MFDLHISIALDIVFPMTLVDFCLISSLDVYTYYFFTIQLHTKTIDRGIFIFFVVFAVVDWPFSQCLSAHLNQRELQFIILKVISHCSFSTTGK
jgi:hypothetical protein